ncbi:single-stranded-DNA-specific exonuclease RecJ [Lentibacillus sediminis]|uniref:single-stranded-DNA-specific exonuclease RecJ n=1 Tax=Lentibacillus sediminis TaxID=1940529 RepID=UPI000C1C27D9|nr:single-stranded-DNA-specific exonuclease RecJ [Lentibacillus sediminis]
MLQSKANWKYTDMEKDLWMDKTIGQSQVVQSLLLQRGINTAEAAAKFLSPDLADLHNPATLDSIDKAGRRVHQAIARQEKILIFGDYDADGVTSTVLLFKTLKELGAKCNYYIPNRFTEGYGPNKAAFKQAYDEEFHLIITVDTGIAAIEEAVYARELGIDLIITDHHEVQEELPDAYAIIHPKCSPDYMFQELAGVGVALKFSQYLLGDFPEHLLPFTAIGTIADLVPLVGENRILAYHGLRGLTTSQNPGINALKKLCNIGGTVTEEDVGFLIGPRLNAVGRLQDASLAVQLLLTEDETQAEEMAQEVQQLNIQRQQIVSQIVKEAETMMENPEEQGVIIVAKEGWNEGVLGIVASKLVRKYDRPAIVLAKRESGEMKGSARSIPAFDLFKNCMKIRDAFTHFGGHSQAAGMTFPAENLNRLQQELNRMIFEELTEDDFKQEIAISKSITVAEINEQLIKEIGLLAPFGMNNPKPIFEVKAVPHEARQIGSKKNHLKLHFREQDAALDGIGFGMGESLPFLSPKTPVTLAGELGINEWNGIRKAQLLIQDLKIDEWQLFDHRGKKNATVPVDSSQRSLTVGIEANRLPDAVSVTYETDVNEISETDSLYILELPENPGDLIRIIQAAKPVNIHACYYVEDSVYLKAFPTRADFKWFYALVAKKRQLDLKSALPWIMQTKGWDKERIVFMAKVFFELGFVKIDNGVIENIAKPLKKDLADAVVYQERIARAEIEKTLYYSNYEELKQWFAACMDHLPRPKEEASYGL